MKICQKPMRHCILAFLLLVLQSTIAPAKPRSLAQLRQSIRHIIDTAGGKIGVGVLEINGHNEWAINPATHYPMQSVYKFQLALAILSEIDKGELALDKIIHVPQHKLDSHTWSPLVKKFPAQDVDISVADLLMYTVSKSDNNTCDVLFEVAGGPMAVDRFIKKLGIKDMVITTTEAEMKTAWKVQYTNWTTPGAMVKLLLLFENGKILSAKNTAYLKQLMTETENSPNRIKGLLPANAVFTHKTGTSNTDAQGMTAATNDIGILTLPDGSKLAIAAFVSDYKGGVAKGERTIAAISKMIWDYYNR